jgi:hypothetical protein
METQEQIKSMKGTTGQEDLMQINNTWFAAWDYQNQVDEINQLGLRWPKGVSKTWKPTHRYTWTWDVRTDRQGNYYAVKTNEKYEVLK